MPRTITSAENRIHKIQQGANGPAGIVSRRWAAYYPLFIQSGKTSGNAVADNASTPNMPDWLTNLAGNQIPTGRTLVAERLKFTLKPYNFKSATFPTVTYTMIEEALRLFGMLYHQWGRLGSSDGFDAEFTGTEVLPFVHNVASRLTASSSTSDSVLSVGTYGGEKAGEYKLASGEGAIPVAFGQQVQMVHKWTLPADPYAIAPSLFATSHASGDYADWLIQVHVQGALTRQGI
jgi:hypothetical protein